MHLKYEFEMLEMGDTISAVPVGDSYKKFRAVLKLNDVGAQMLRYVAECETPEEVLEKLCADYPEDDRDDVAQKLCDFLNQLHREGLLVP